RCVEVVGGVAVGFFFFSSRRRHTRLVSDWSSDVCSSDLIFQATLVKLELRAPSAAPRSKRAARAPAPDEAPRDDFVARVERVCRSEERRVGKEWRARWAACE